VAQAIAMPAPYQVCRFIEHRILPAAFLLMAGFALQRLWYLQTGVIAVTVHPAADLTFIKLNLVLSITYNLVISSALFKAHMFSQARHNIVEIAIPFLAQLFPLLSNVILLVPPIFSELLALPIRTEVRSILSIMLMVLGMVMAIWGTVALGKNFAITVSVNDIVTSGPYRFLRHPIYCGQITAMFGYCLMFPTLFTFMSMALLIAIQWTRAALETRHIYR
jgi:protein-S-isoprenylcysteine O-methyltransferase Ste14